MRWTLTTYSLPVSRRTTSSCAIPLMEIAAPRQAMAPGSNPGIEIGRPYAGGRGTWSLGVYGDVGANNEYGNASRNSGNAVGRVTGLAVDRIDSDQQRCAASVPLKARTPTCGTPEVPMKYQERAWPVSRLPGVRRRPAEPAAIGVGSGSRRARATPTVPVPYALAFMEEPR